MISSKRVIVQDAAYEARRRVALLVGADRTDEFPPLPPETIAADIQCLKEVFSSDHAGYRHVDTLMGEQATKQGILQGIERLSSDLTPDDVFLFYFSGHGFREGDHSYLLPKDAKRKDLVETSIAMDEILSRIPPIYATIFIADACHQEGILDLGFAFPLEMPENVAGLTSSRPSELSYVFPELRNSLYTHYLLEGLRGSADPANRGRVTIFDLYRYVSRKVRDYALTKNVSQTPTLSFNGIEDFVVAGAPTPQESLDEEQRRAEAGDIRGQMISAAEKEEWLRTLEKWDRLLEIDPEANRSLSTAIEARRALDQLPIPSEDKETSLLLSYPRIWPCRREDPPIHPNTLVVHPDVRKGDLLLQYEVSDNTTLIQCAYVAETNAFQALAQDGIVRSYTILESKIDLSYPPLTLKKLAAEMRNPKMQEAADQWEQFEAWSGDLRSSGVWDDLRYQILKGHTHAAASLLTAELAPLAFGLSARPDDPELREAVTNLFEKYKKLVKQPRSQLSGRELDARQEEFWSQIRPSESSEQPAISAQVPRVSDREAPPQKRGAERVPSVFTDGFALLIGVNESKEPQWALPEVLKDVTALRDVLADPRYCAYPVDHIGMINGKQATRAAIMDGLGSLKQKVEADPNAKNTTVLVYYSGHGWVDSSSEPPTSFLVPYDVAREHVAASVLSIGDFAQALTDIRPKNLLVVLDCSHSGLMAEQITERIPKNQSFAILTSSRGDQQSYTRRDRAMSVFTYHLIEALLGQGQPAGSPYVLISDVMSYVHRKTPETVHVEWGTLQEPEFRLTANFAIGLLWGGQGALGTQAAQQAMSELLRKARTTVEETPKTSAASLSANQRIWFVTADPQDSRDSRGYRWRERAFQSGKERWTEVTNPTGKHFMSLARKGDLILAYQSTPVQEIVGIGRVQGDAEPHEDRWAVPLEDFVEIPKGVTLGDLKEIVPKLSHVQNPQSAFSPVSPGQWERIRGQIVERCPDLASQLPLPASAEPVLMLDMLSDRMQAAAGSVFPVRLTLRNTGNVPFRKGERFKLALEWSGEDAQPGDEPAYRQAPSQVLSADLPPTTPLDLPERSVTAPAEVGAFTIRWTWESQDWGEPLSFVGEPMAFQVVPVGPVVPAYLTRIDQVEMPATVRAGETLAASLSLRNAGANVWRAGDAFRIECIFEKPPDERSDPLWSSWERSINVDVRSDSDAPASAMVSFSDLTLDTTGIAQGDYKVMWRVTNLSHPDMSAATETRALHIGPPRAYGLEIAGIAGIPEETDTGASLSPVLTLSNTGEIAWKAGDPLRVTGEFEGSGGIALSKPRLAWDGSLTSDTPVGETMSVSLPVLGIPAEPGKYRLHWSLAGPAWGVKASQTSDLRVILPPLPVDRITGTNLKAGRAAADELFKHKTPYTDQQLTETLAQQDSLGLARAQALAGDSKLDPAVREFLGQALQAALPPVRHEFTVSRLAKYQAPDDANLVRIKVYSDTVELEFDGQTYSSPFAIDPKLLQRLAPDPSAYGRVLFNAIFSDKKSPAGLQGSDTRVGYLTALRKTEGRMRIEFRLASNSLNLYGHAWEYLQEDWEGGRFLALQERSPFYRLIDGQTQTLSGQPPRPHILFAICSPNTLGQLGRVSDLRGLNVAAERKIIDDQLRERQKDELLKYEILAAEGNGRVTLDVLHNKLKQGQHNILHLVCHGKFFREGEISKPGYYLIMEDQDGTDDLVSPEIFLKVISARDGIRLVVLAACQSAQGDEAGSALRSLGFDLVQSGIPAVVAMQKRVAVETAQEFAHHFYNDLARCGRIDMALAATRLSLKMSDVESRIPGHWGIPVLFTSIAGCGQFFSINSKAAEDAPEGKPVVKDYAGLGASDPRPDIMGHGFREQARQLYGPGFAAAERLPVIIQDALADEGGPLVPGQNRPALDIKIKAPVDIKASDLKDFVERQSSKLSLDMLVYAQIAAALNAGKHVVLIGPPGTGKTSLAHAICRFAESRDFSAGSTLTTATADWTTFDTVGGYVPTRRQTLQFRPGIFLCSICHGHWLVIDEINRAEIDKAFGEVFTLLSGQGVDLPYSVGDTQVRILPPRPDWPNWIPGDAINDYHYVAHPNWRIIGTMNVYDKSHLFSMSFAFMRRFAFIDTGLPTESVTIDGVGTRTVYEKLIHDWINERVKLPPEQNADVQTEQLARNALETTMGKLLKPKTLLMERRALGPAIAKDMIEYVGCRYCEEKVSGKLLGYLGEAFLLYAVPQLDGLARLDIASICDDLKGVLMGSDDASKKITECIVERIHDMYPHLTPEDWLKLRKSGEPTRDDDTEHRAI